MSQYSITGKANRAKVIDILNSRSVRTWNKEKQCHPFKKRELKKTPQESEKEISHREREREREREMRRLSNTVIGFLNLFTLLASIPIIGGGLWMARNSTSCESFLQTPLLVVGFVVLVISLAGFIGACFHVAWALWVYLVVMLFLIGTLMALTVFGFVVTSQGGGVEVPGRVYKEYRLQDYSPWLRNRIKDPNYWMTIRSCILGSKTCAKIALWTPLDYLEKDMSPIQVNLFFFFLFF